VLDAFAGAVAVHSGHKQRERVTVDRGQRAHRRAARTSSRLQNFALYFHREPDGPLIERREHAKQVGVSATSLNGESALRRCGSDDLRSQPLVDLLATPEAIDPCRCEHQGVHGTLVEASKTCVDVAMQWHDAEVGARRQQKSHPARTVGADNRSAWQGVQRAGPGSGDKGIARIRSLRVCGDQQLGLLLQRDVLGAVHGDVDFTRDKCACDRGDEHAFARRHVDGPNVAVGHDANQLNPVACLPQTLGEKLALDDREL